MAVKLITSNLIAVFTVIIIFNIVTSGKVSTTCNHPGEPINGEAISDKDEFSMGEEISFRCSQNFILIGEEKVECLRNGSWSSPIPHCGWNVAWGKQTECIEERMEKDVEKFSSVTDGSHETCLNIKNKLTLVFYLAEQTSLFVVNVYAEGTAIFSYNIRVEIFKDSSLRNATNRVCNLDYKVRGTTLQKYSCGSYADKQSVGAIRITFFPVVEMELCEIEAYFTNDNLLRSKEAYIPMETKTKCLTPFTDGNISSISTHTLNNNKTLLINLMGTYDIDMFILIININNQNEMQNRTGYYFYIYIEVGNDTEDRSTFHFCRRLSDNEARWINNTIKFSCLQKSTTYNTIRLTFKANGRYNISVNFQEFQILTTQSQLGFKRTCKTKPRSRNCVAREMFDSNGTQYLLYSPKNNYLTDETTINQCFEGSWKTKPPPCIFSEDSFALQESTNNQIYKILTFVLMSICIVCVIGVIFLIATKRARVSWTKHTEVPSRVKVCEEIVNDIYDSSRLEKIKI